MEPLFAHLVEAARRAPSPHNTQPWRLRWGDDRLEVLVPQDRMLPACDPAGNDVLHAVGALVENVTLALAQHGLQSRLETSKRMREGEPIATVYWQPAAGERPDPTLYRMIPVRRTSRLPYRLEALPAAVIQAAAEAARPCTLRVVQNRDMIWELRKLVATATAHQLADRAIARELYAWMRFSRRDSRWYRDGLNAACMGLADWQASVARVLLAPPMLAGLVGLGLHKPLCADVDAQAPPSSAVCLLTMTGDGVAARIDAGRCLQRAWLTAAAHGLATHPLSAAVDVGATRPRVLELFGVGAGAPYVNLFRLGVSDPPALSPRLPADEIVERRFREPSHATVARPK